MTSQMRETRTSGSVGARGEQSPWATRPFLCFLTPFCASFCADPFLCVRLNPAATEANESGKSLAEMIREAMAAEGVTDADFSRITG
jgi:hypothetical protein